MRHALILAILLPLAACSTDQLDKFSTGAAKVGPALTAACNTATTLANIAGLVPGVGAIVPYITAGCHTAEGIAKLAADPHSTEWLGTLSGQIKGLAALRGMKV